MKIIKENINCKYFNQVKEFEIFGYDDETFLKIPSVFRTSDTEEFNVINLDKDEYDYFYPNILVTLCTAELNIKL